MLNIDAVLKMIEGYTNRNNEIDENKFLQLISGLEEDEAEEVLTILADNHITVLEEVSDDVNSFGDYKSLSRLTNEELCVLYQHGDRTALDALCINNDKLIHKIAIRTLNEYNPDCLTEEDLYIEGNLGLMTAAERYDVTTGNKFSTYAVWWIRQSITREVMNNGYGMRLPVHIFEQVIKVNKVRKALRNGTISDIQERLFEDYGREYTLEQVQQLLTYADKYLNTTSLNKVIGDEDGNSEIMDFIPSVTYVEDEVMENVVRDEIEKALTTTLSDKENKIIHMRYGLGNQSPMTLEQIGKIYNVTRERIRQIESKALKKLARKSRIFGLEGLLIA